MVRVAGCAGRAARPWPSRRSASRRRRHPGPPPYAPGLHPGLPQYLSPISRMTC